MTSVNLPRDDIANLVDTRAVANRTVKEVSAYPSAHAVEPHEDVMQAPHHQPRKQEQRRRRERRHDNQPVILDTRSGRDRRNIAREAEVEVEGDISQGRTGIDVYS